jgi:hypothetical protein
MAEAEMTPAEERDFVQRMNGTGGETASLDGRYRYSLIRRWGHSLMREPDERSHVWIMLNPSTADAVRDDPTIRIISRISRDLGAPGIRVVNLFALRATDPADLRRTAKADLGEAIGPHTDAMIAVTVTQAAAWGAPVICAWGGMGRIGDRDRDVFAILKACGVSPKCLNLTDDGSPRHPLRNPSRTLQTYDWKWREP